MRTLVKGYGDTHERGQAKFERLAALIPWLRAMPNSARQLDTLIKAALAEEGSAPLDKAIAALDDGGAKQTATSSAHA
jgi:indolepyruvate ferredoxin oxidoreductase beta subunit